MNNTLSLHKIFLFAMSLALIALRSNQRVNYQVMQSGWCQAQKLRNKLQA